MTSLNLFIKPLTVELAARTLLSHNSRGIALYLTTGKSPFALSFILGLSTKLQWYKPVLTGNDVDTLHANKILGLATSLWSHGLNKLDLNMLHLRLASMPESAQMDCMNNVLRFLNRARYVSNKLERCNLMQMNDAIPKDVMMRLQSSLASLEASLLEKDPMLSQHLRNTHSILISYPESVHLLDDNEIARIIDAAEIHTKTEIVKAAAAGKGATRKKVTADDL